MDRINSFGFCFNSYGGFQICVSRKYFRFSSVSYFVFNFRRRRYCVYTILCDFGCALRFYAQGKYKALVNGTEISWEARKDEIMANISVIGSGGWGSAVAIMLAKMVTELPCGLT